MDINLQYEDLLIKLRAKLNEEKVRLWESPYLEPDNKISQSLQDLAEKYSNEFSIEKETVIQALHELQLHSLERSKANAEFKETGYATFRVRAMISNEKPGVIKVVKKLDVMGSDLIMSIATEIGVIESRVKLIFNGKVIKPTPSLEKQGVKNGVQIMALIMAESPEEVKKEDTMYMEMKAIREDATLLSECVDNLADDDEYMKLEDQSGKAVELPAAEKRALLVGLALHERGRAAAKQKNYTLALVLFLEADRQLSECRSSILDTVDNWAVLQLDIAWSYLCLRSLASAGDAAARLAKAAHALARTYGPDHRRLVELKGTAANERALMMRLCLLQGIVAYHQNNRAEAKSLLERAEAEMNGLRVDENAVSALMELGWSRSQARNGLRCTAGDVDRAHHILDERRAHKEQERKKHRSEREAKLFGRCADGSPVRGPLVQGLVGMGYSRQLAVAALRLSNNHVADAVRIIQEQPELIADSDLSSDTGTPSSDDSFVEPDNKLVAELEAMGYAAEDSKAALRMARNHVGEALDLLLAGDGHVANAADPGNPSTSSGKNEKLKQRKHKGDKRKQEREEALKRLSSAINMEDDDYLDTSLVEEEEFLAQYKSLL